MSQQGETQGGSETWSLPLLMSRSQYPRHAKLDLLMGSARTNRFHPRNPLANSAYLHNTGDQSHFKPQQLHQLLVTRAAIDLVARKAFPQRGASPISPVSIMKTVFDVVRRQPIFRPQATATPVTGPNIDPLRHAKIRPTTSQPNISITSYDEFADLRLEVGTPPVSFMVCSRAMARGSPAFKAMLFGGFAESKPVSGDWVVRLPEDDPQAFAIILEIFHGRIDRVPDRLTSQQSPTAPSPACSTLLYHVALIADKYCMLTLLRPWANLWLQAWRLQPEGSGWYGEVITAAWLLGDELLLLSQLEKAVLHARHRGVPWKGRLWVEDAYGVERRLGGMPDGPTAVIDREGLSQLIFDARIELIDDLMDPWREAFLNPENFMPNGLPAEHAEFTRILNHATEATTARINFSSQLDRYKGTVTQLFDSLIQVKPYLANMVQHMPYTPGFRDRVNHAMTLMVGQLQSMWTEPPSFIQLTDDHKAHLARRRKMTGVVLTS